MKKRIFSVITLCVIMLFTGCKPSTINDSIKPNVDSSTASETFEVNPPFFKVTDEKTGAEVYMLGSMHIGKRGAEYPAEIYAAIDKCDTLAVEVDVPRLENDTEELRDAMNVLKCKDGTTVKDYMGNDYDEIVGKFKEKGYYNQAYEQYIPALWTSQWTNKALKNTGYETDTGTDRIMLNYAKEKCKKIDEIETAKEQYQANADTSTELQMLSLKQTISLSDEETQAQLDTLYNAWKSADMETLKSLVADDNDNTPEELQDDYKRYYDGMYTNRQKKMSDYIETQLQTGNKTFVVVGALHYAAPPSILDNLENDGYTIETLSKKGLNTSSAVIAA